MTEIKVFDLWIEQPILVISAYFLLLVGTWVLLRKNIPLRQKEYARHYHQQFYVIDYALRKIESEDPSKLLPRTIIQFWIFRMVFIVLLATSQYILINSGIVFFGDILTIFLGLYFCRQSWSALSLLNHYFLFTDVIKNPTDVTGTIFLSNTFLYRQTKASLLIPTILWLFLFTLVGHIFFLGGILDFFVFGFSLSRWEKKDAEISFFSR
ncbi:MAG: hypothetical protein ACW98F_11330 [Candidatus Hodarchaeales archaeon]